MKNKRKWNRKNYFANKKNSDKRKNNSHPVYVYGGRRNYRKYLLFTHTPEEGKEDNFEKLNYNIDPNDKRDCYVKRTYEIAEEKSLLIPKVKYRIHDSDKEKIKKYKK